MDYEDRKWSVERSGERDNEKVSVGEMQHQKKKERKKN